MSSNQSVRTLITLAKSADVVTIRGRRSIVQAALTAERALNARVYRWTHPEADAEYGEHFAHYLNNVRHDQKRADAYACKMTRATFPNLPALPGRRGKAKR